MRRHGFIATYEAGCRCAECRRAAADKRRRRRQETREDERTYMCPLCGDWFMPDGRSITNHERQRHAS